ncbi:hypothetical protein AVEN_233411-1 [Araneus ventricosus]|uniref:Uncharacterized protein n=1 Tax=Araneus ventricosus TaxID=182803 RepID=A0A4Y2L735_ARAVE|nr:hypothetical protein AVEN_233411-1 [Araneus ventricosus]
MHVGHSDMFALSPINCRLLHHLMQHRSTSPGQIVCRRGSSHFTPISARSLIADGGDRSKLQREAGLSGNKGRRLFRRTKSVVNQVFKLQPGVMNSFCGCQWIVPLNGTGV